MIKDYYRLTKPGIIYGNCLSAIAGFFLASNGHIKIGLFLAMISGISLIIGSACVFNNYLDKDIDALMDRTKKRAIASGRIKPVSALIYGTVLFIAGAGLLLIFTNFLTFWVAWVGFVVYVLVYGYFKRRSVHGTVIGSVSGAVPPVVGYCAASNNFDTGALLLFLILVFWQMPHFYGIALYREKDYRAAHIPVLPIVSGARVAKLQTLVYIVSFIVACTLLTVFGYGGYTLLLASVVVGLVWLVRGVKNYSVVSDKIWGRQMFLFSLIVLLVFCTFATLNAWLP